MIVGIKVLAMEFYSMPSLSHQERNVRIEESDRLQFGGEM